MSQPERIRYCHGCGRVAESSTELLAKGCEGTHQRYVRSDIIGGLLRAIDAHTHATEAEVSKAAWSVANGKLYRAAADVERVLEERGEIVESSAPEG